METENPYLSPWRSAEPGRTVPQLEPPQAVSYRLTEEEVLAASKHLTSSNRTVYRYVRRRQRILLLCAGVMAFLSTMIALTDSVSHPLCVICGVMAAVMCMLAMRIHTQNSRAWAKLQKQILTEEDVPYDIRTQATLMADGIQYATDEGHSFRKWAAVPKIERIEGQLLVYDTPLTANCIPGRAFFDEAMFEAYCQLAERLWRDAVATNDAPSG